MMMKLCGHVPPRAGSYSLKSQISPQVVTFFIPLAIQTQLPIYFKTTSTARVHTELPNGFIDLAPLFCMYICML